MMTRLDSVERAVADIAAGKAVVVIDDEDRENEGDLIFAAEKATPELVAFMVRYTSGYLCVPLDGAICDKLGLLPMYAVNQDKHGTAYTVTVDAERRRRHRNLGVRPRDHDAAARRPDQRRRGLHPARPRRTAASQGRRGATQARPHRGRRRPCPVGRSAAGGRDLRDRQPEGRGRDGADRRTSGLRRRTRPCADLDRRPHRVAPQAREAHRARSPRPASRPGTASSARSATPASTTRSSTSHWSVATSQGRTATGMTCWCGCTPSA